MIKINKVKSLKKEREFMYGDLKKGDAFTLDDDNYPRIKTDVGYCNLSNFTQWGNLISERKVIPVDAEINWAYKDGE